MLLLAAFREKSLFEMFVESLKDIVGTVTPPTPEAVKETTYLQHVYMENIATEHHVTGAGDQLLQINFQAIFSTLFVKTSPKTDPCDLRQVLQY